MAPDVFWRLHPREFHWLCDGKRQSTRRYGRMTEAEVAAIYEETYGQET